MESWHFLVGNLCRFSLRVQELATDRHRALNISWHDSMDTKPKILKKIPKTQLFHFFLNKILEVGSSFSALLASPLVVPCVVLTLDAVI